MSTSKENLNPNTDLNLLLPATDIYETMDIKLSYTVKDSNAKRDCF
ncbi:MAG: hypothetical protein JWP81_529 [Ferruginibacter sp.]|nr:hypothetical protein [Ferruginibacter sp.]